MAKHKVIIRKGRKIVRTLEVEVTRHGNRYTYEPSITVQAGESFELEPPVTIPLEAIPHVEWE